MHHLLKGMISILVRNHHRMDLTCNRQDTAISSISSQSHITSKDQKLNPLDTKCSSLQLNNPIIRYLSRNLHCAIKQYPSVRTQPSSLPWKSTIGVSISSPSSPLLRNSRSQLRTPADLLRE